jgi:hypothetical protein
VPNTDEHGAKQWFHPCSVKFGTAAIGGNVLPGFSWAGLTEMSLHILPYARGGGLTVAGGRPNVRTVVCEKSLMVLAKDGGGPDFAIIAEPQTAMRDLPRRKGQTAWAAPVS